MGIYIRIDKKIVNRLKDVKMEAYLYLMSNKMPCWFCLKLRHVIIPFIFYSPYNRIKIHNHECFIYMSILMTSNNFKLELSKSILYSYIFTISILKKINIFSKNSWQNTSNYYQYIKTFYIRRMVCQILIEQRHLRHTILLM